MDENSSEPMMPWRFVRRYFMRIAIGTVLSAAVYFATSVYATYQREQRIAEKIVRQSCHLAVELGYCGPSWVPYSIQDSMPLCDRIRSVDLSGQPVTSDLLLELRLLTHIDALRLSNTHITDADLETLKGLTSLRTLGLEDTQTTAEGRAMLRKELPNCKITPNP